MQPSLPLTGGFQGRRHTYRVTAPPLTHYACHCHACRVQSGGAFGCSTSRRAPTLVNVKPGTLDDTGWLYPMAHLWLASAQFGIGVPAAVLGFAGQPADVAPGLRRALRRRKSAGMRRPPAIRVDAGLPFSSSTPSPT